MRMRKGCEHRMNEGYRAWEALKSMLCYRGLGIKAKKCQYEGVIIPNALYGAEAWGMRSAERRKVKVLEMNIVLEVCLECHEWIEIGMKRCVGELE